MDRLSSTNLTFFENKLSFSLDRNPQQTTIIKEIKEKKNRITRKYNSKKMKL
jgi:hypothetical protein